MYTLACEAWVRGLCDGRGSLRSICHWGRGGHLEGLRGVELDAPGDERGVRAAQVAADAVRVLDGALLRDSGAALVSARQGRIVVQDLHARRAVAGGV